MQNRITAVMVFCGILASILVLRAAKIQIYGDSRLAAIALKQFKSKVLVSPKRGLILDRNGEALAVNTESKSLAANPGKIKNRKTLARLISKALDIPYSKVIDRLTDVTGKKEFVWLKRQLSEGDFSRLKKWHVIDSDEEMMTGLWLVKENKRIYPHRDLAGHVIGDVNLDSEGLEGVELWSDQTLRGKVSSMSAVRDALGRPAFIDTAGARYLQEGQNVQLTLDASLQFSAEQELRNSVIHTGAQGGSVVVMNASSGEILAMANEPSFNPNDSSAPAWRRRNRALTDGFEPGSTIKPILLAAALASGHRLNEQIWGEKGSFTVQGKAISEAEAHERFEWISLEKMIQVSSNIAAAKLALKMGPDRYFSALNSFGFGSRTGLGFPGEYSGKIPSKAEWTQLALANFGFGQGFTATPLQVTRAYAVFANGGWLVHPTLIKNLDPVVKSSGTGRILSQRTTDQIQRALRTVTQEGGTGVQARVDGYQIAGKTGTSQVVDPATRRYSKSHFISSFVGFAVGVEPRIVAFVSLDRPKGSYYASETAAPLFARVFQAAANRFSLPTLSKVIPMAQKTPEVKDHLRLSIAKVTDPLAADVAQEMSWKGMDPGTGVTLWAIPNFHGLTLREAMRIIHGKRFEISVRGNGVIQSQSPQADSVVQEGSKLKWVLADP